MAAVFQSAEFRNKGGGRFGQQVARPWMYNGVSYQHML